MCALLAFRCVFPSSSHTHYTRYTPHAPRLCQLWDTAGQERFRTIAVAYFRGAHASMLVFDLTSRPSFLAVESWVKDIDKNADKKVAKILVGNKADLAESEPGRRAVKEEDAIKVANAHGMTYIETSAKSGANVEAAFERLAGLALESLKKVDAKPSPIDKKVNLKKEEKPAEKKQGWGC